MINETMATRELLQRLLKIDQKVDLGLMNLRIAHGFFEDAKRQICDMLDEVQRPQS